MKRIAPLLIIVLALACGKKSQDPAPTPSQETIDLTALVVESPPPVVSATAMLEVHFNRALVSESAVDQKLDPSPISLSPKVDGEVAWITPQCLRFTPQRPLPPGQAYQAVIKGKVLLPGEREVNDFDFAFQVAEQEVVAFEGDFIPDDGGVDALRLAGRLTLAQPVALDKITSDLKLNGPRGRLDVKCSEGSSSGQLRWTSEVVQRTAKPQRFRLSLPKAYAAGKEGWTRELILPEKGVFRVVSHGDMTPPNARQRVYGFRFGDPVQREADLSGYVAVEPAVSFTVRAQGKHLLLEGDFIPGQRYTARLAQGLPSAYGGRTAGDYEAAFTFDNLKPEMAWLSEGVYLPAGNEDKIQFRSVNVARVTVRVTEIHPQNIGFFLQRNVVQDRTRQDANRYSAFEYQDLSRVGEVVYEEQQTLSQKRNRWIKTELDLSHLFKNRHASLWVVSLQFDRDDLTGRPVSDRNDLGPDDLYFEGDNYYTNPTGWGYYYAKGTINKLVIASDIGLTLKETGEGIRVYAADLRTTKPVAGLALTLYTYQNRALKTVSTDGQGMAAFGQTGAYVMGQSDQGIALLKMDHPAWQINNFDVSGSQGAQSGNSAFIYTERGVHRPGDTLHLAAICRVGTQPPPEKQPIALVVRNPQGQVVLETQQPAGPQGHVGFDIPTRAQDPTGPWSATLSFGGSDFYHELRVETVKPNRLKIAWDLPSEITAQPPRLTGTLTARYLFGAPASDLRAQVTAQISGAAFNPKGWTDFTFNAPVKSFSPRYLTILDDDLDADGRIQLDYPVPDARRAPGPLRVELNTTVTEPGGDFTEQQSAVRVHPFSAYVGLKNVFEWGYVQTDQEIAMPLVVVDPQGRAVAGHRLAVRLYVNRSHWWYDYDRRGRQDFRRMSTTTRLGEVQVVSGAEPVVHHFRAEDKGRHYIEVVDLDTGHEAGLFFYASPWGDAPQTQEPDRNTLVLNADRDVYHPGDKAVLRFDAPAQGAALFTVEQGQRILDQRWIRLTAPQTVVEVPVTSEMLPNAYAVVSLIQPQNQNDNDAPMRIYGVCNLAVEDAATRLPITLEVPETLRPSERFSLTVRSAAPKAASFTVAVVDEGLLDLTRFATPSPWDFYFQKVGLHVITRDNYDQVLGLRQPDMDRYVSIGGGLMDEAMAQRLDEGRTRRFPPVVLYQAPMTLKPGKSTKLDFALPNYVGSVRIMVVAASGHSYASLEQTVPVKQPLMVLPTVPRVARPGDVFDLPVSVFAMDSSVTRAQVELVLPANCTAEGPRIQQVDFARPEEKDVTFCVAVGSDLGAANLRISAKAGSESASAEVALPINSPNPFYTEITDTVAYLDKPVSWTPEPFGIPGTSKARIAFTRLPDIQLSSRVGDLLDYPYGCLEQCVSSVFPQLFLDQLVDLDAAQRQAVTQHVNAAMERLSRYKIDGGFAYWPLSEGSVARPSDWGGTYVGHFLAEAQAKGYHVPPDLWDHWLRSAQRQAKAVNTSNHRYQAYRLFVLVLALAQKPDMGAMNLLRENHLNRMDALSRKLLAAAYALAGQKPIADQIAAAVPADPPAYRESGGTFGSPLRDLALSAYLSIKLDDAATASRLIRALGKAYRPGLWASTQETAMAVLALGHFVQSSAYTGGSVKFHVNVEGQGTRRLTLDGYQTVMDLDDAWNRRVTVSVDNDNPLFVTFMAEGVPLESRVRTEHSGLTLGRSLFDDLGRPLALDAVTQGQPFWVVYRVESQHGEPLENLALSSLFPSGWEIVNLRLTGQAPPPWVEALGADGYDYMDLRDDRVNWFFGLPSGGRQTLAVKINPSFKGDYVLPPVSVEGMYTPEVYARLAGGRSVVR